LHKLLQDAEDKELNCDKRNNRINIYPKFNSGSPVDDLTARPTIVIRYNEKNNLLVLSWIYIYSEGKGIGSKVIEVIIDFCKRNRIDRFSINSIRKDNKAMLALGSKFKMTKQENSELDFYDLVLDLR